jgi:SAM-dependent methyltransferase
MTDIAKLIRRLPANEMAFGGSHGGRVYQDYPWEPLNELPAKRASTAARLEFLGPLADWQDRTVLDVGCANGAISIGLAKFGARVTGWDWNPSDLAVAKAAAKVLGVDVKFLDRDIIFAGVRQLANIDKGPWDIGVYLSVWKWIAWRNNLQSANQTLTDLGRCCKMLIFESGLTGTGIDLVQTRMDEVEPMLREHTNYDNIEMVGCFPRDDQQVDRPVWRCW